MISEQHQNENEIHANRIIRRRLDAERHEWLEGEREALLSSAIKAAEVEGLAYSLRAKKIEEVVHRYKSGLVNANNVEITEETPAFNAEESVESSELASANVIDTTGLPARTVNALDMANITTVDQLRAWKDENNDFTRLDGVGVSSAAKLEALIGVEEAGLQPEANDEGAEADSEDQAE